MCLLASFLIHPFVLSLLRHAGPAGAVPIHAMAEVVVSVRMGNRSTNITSAVTSLIWSSFSHYLSHVSAAVQIILAFLCARGKDQIIGNARTFIVGHIGSDRRRPPIATMIGIV